MVRNWGRRHSAPVQLKTLAAATAISVKTAPEFEKLGPTGVTSEHFDHARPPGYGASDLARLKRLRDLDANGR